MNKPGSLGQSILEISKIVMFKFWYDYLKRNHGEKAKLCCMDADSFLAYMRKEDLYLDIANYVEARFDTSNYELDGSLPEGKSKKVIGLMKHELGGWIIMKTFVRLKAKTFGYFIYGSRGDKNAKGTKICH